MSDDSKIKDIVDVVKVVVEAVPVYQDAIQPAAKEIGKGLETIAKTINIALAPLKALIWGYEKIADYLEGALAQKLKHVPTERIVTPSLNILGPAVESLKFTAHEPALRELYVNLLATSLDLKTANEAHPAFVEIIKQMTPDEAMIVKLFATKNVFPLINIKIYDFKFNEQEYDKSPLLKMRLLDRSYRYLPINFSAIGIEAACEHNQLTPYYINNLCRLGLAEVPEGASIADTNLYEILENQSDIQEFKQHLEEKEPNKTVTFQRGILGVTPLGKQFCTACAIERN